MVNKENIVIQKININVETNIEGEKPFELTYKRINNPIPTGEYTSNTSELDYPYFTPDIAYSPEVLVTYLNRDYGKVVRTFFDVNLFSEMVNVSKLKNKYSNIDANEIVDNNIYLTLLFLFPMRYPQSANVNSSYDKYIRKQLFNKYKNYFPSSDTLSSAFLGQIYDIKKEAVREYSYVNTSEGIATVTEIVWLNDVLNNKKYRGLIDKLIQYDNWFVDKKETIYEEIINAQKDLITSMQKEELKITKDDVIKIESQKNISYSSIDLTNDIVNVIKKYVVLVEGENNKDNKNTYKCMKSLYDDLFIIDENNVFFKLINEEKNQIDVETLIEKIKNNILFDLNLTRKPSKIRHIGKDFKFIISDFLKYNRMEKTPYIKLLYKENDNKINEIDFSLIEITYAKTQPKDKTKIPENVIKEQCNIIETKDYYNLIEKTPKNELIKKNIYKMLDNIKSDITKSIKNYNTNYSNKKNVSKFSENQFLKIDIKIDKAVEEMNNIINIINNKDIVNILNKKDTEKIDENEKEILNTEFKKIMNAVDSLKTFFSESSIRENSITGVSSIQIKLEKILKKSNEIKALQLVQQYLFSDIAKGIYLYYDDEKTESGDILKNELKKEKYSFFTNTVKYIKDNFLNVESTNEELTKLMRYYFENTGNGFIEKVINPAKQAINENVVDEKNKLFNIGVTKITSNKENMPVYEIDIYMELIIGQVDYQKQKKIKCEYRDEKLLAYFDKFVSNPKYYEIIKKKAIKLNDGTENVKNTKNTNNEKKMKGGKTMRKKKYLQNNKRYTSKRK